jgi:hypothetical protein
LFDEVVLNSTMKKNFYLLSFIFSLCNFAFRKQKLVVLLWIKQTSLFLCKHSFKDSNEGAVANEDGRFILNLKTYGTLVVTSVGF